MQHGVLGRPGLTNGRNSDRSPTARFLDELTRLPGCLREIRAAGRNDGRTSLNLTPSRVIVFYTKRIFARE